MSVYSVEMTRPPHGPDLGARQLRILRVSGVLGCDRGDIAPTDRIDCVGLAHHTTCGELSLGVVLARLKERKREIAGQADGTRGQITQLAARLKKSPEPPRTFGPSARH
jgi:hypothetical protein